MERFHQTLVQEVMPAIERAYRVAKDRGSRAIAGLSMGGAQALHAGLRDGQRFAWVGGFSSAVVDDLASTFVPTGSRPDDLRLLWIACGRQDRLMAVNRDLVAWLESKGIRHTAVETEGDHAWMVWRRNLATFAGLLFR